ncbi:MAG: hypothetical protein SPF78_21345 [Lachnospiraceae bacterium]|nr:hypothetical protein [Lachnospiraceae bacterium]
MHKISGNEHTVQTVVIIIEVRSIICGVICWNIEDQADTDIRCFG